MVSESPGSKAEPPFYCDEPGCGKSFKRSDHLSRHRQNHRADRSYQCTWMGCNKSFIRKDVREKHMRRHEVKREKQRGKVLKFEHYRGDEGRGQGQGLDQGSEVGSEVLGLGPMDLGPMDLGPMDLGPMDLGPMDLGPMDLGPMDLGPMDLGPMDLGPMDLGLGPQVPVPQVPVPQVLGPQQVLRSEVLVPQVQVLGPDVPGPNTQVPGHVHTLGPLPTDPFADLPIDWLLDHSAYFYSPTVSLPTTPFTPSTSQSSVSPHTHLTLIDLLPALKFHPAFSPSHIHTFLVHFWHAFHPQFPILHRPSFSTASANPVLVLAMVTVGASVDARSSPDSLHAANSASLADDIALPLRWLICSQADLVPSVQPWIIQSLLILECYETNCSSRKLHRRAHLHHGLKIELLRRSPLLGGDPTGTRSAADYDHMSRQAASASPSAAKSSRDSWVELESLKRCAFMVFLTETYQGLIFGRDTVLSPHHVKLLLPCDDTVWETGGAVGESVKFLPLLKEVLQREDVSRRGGTATASGGTATAGGGNTGGTGPHLVLTGLIGLALQAEHKWPWSHPWKPDILAAIDFWYDRHLHPCRGEAGCLVPIYHMAHAFLRVSQYDCIIYAGAPTRMNVATAPHDLEVVQHRMAQWAHSPHAAISVAHCYALLCETLIPVDLNMDLTLDPRLDPRLDLDHLRYNANTDPLFYRPSTVALAAFLVWGYNYCLHGPESTHYDDFLRPKLGANLSFMYSIADKCIPEKENGADHIRRIGRELARAVPDSTQPLARFSAYARALESIPNKHHTVGLLRLIKTGFDHCTSEIYREYSRLMENCIQRSMGREEVTCTNMYCS